VRDTGGEPSDRFHLLRLAQPLPELLALGLRVLALRDIADRTHDQRALLGLDRTQADFHRKFGSIPTQSVKFEAGTHGSRARMREEAFAVGRMLCAIALRHQHLHKFPQQILTLVTEELLSLRINQHNVALATHDDHRVRGRLQ
jgi:hypothetical protein